MTNNECLSVILSELERHSIKGHVEQRGKHQAVVFSAAGRDYQFFTACTPSDRRAVYNERAEIRRMLRAIEVMPEAEEGFRPLVTVADGEVFTNSRNVADAFEKEHKNVLRDIDKLLNNNDCSILSSPPFREIMLPDGSGILRRTFDMTRSGFVLLAMGFTGAKAFRFKCSYITAFDAMERALHRNSGALEAEEAMRRIAYLQGEVEALTDIVLSLPVASPHKPTKAKVQFIRPSVLRRMGSVRAAS